MPEKLILQIYCHGQWVDAADLEIEEPEQSHSIHCSLNYAITHCREYYNQRAETAVGFSYPVDAIGYDHGSWLRFLDDIMPSGASRDYWVSHLGIADQNKAKQDLELLKHGTIAPIGNLRIKEAVPAKTPDTIAVKFGKQQVADRDSDFLEYATENGAVSGGATGAGGAAPKILLRCNLEDEVWIDTFQDQTENLDTHYLVKFPRNRSEIDKDILRAEYSFYHELEQLGFNTIPIDKMRLIEGMRVPSLWLPRFDVYIENNHLHHCGMESVYSILDEPPAKPLRHTDVLKRLIHKIQGQEYFGDTKTLLDEPDGVAQFVIEWVRRDLLNIAFGNSDNHGRNTSFLKKNNLLTLAPIYDFAPMKADPEQVTRTFTWGIDMELGGNYNFPKIAESLEAWVEPDKLLAALAQTASKLTGLKGRLEQRGVPESITNFRTIGFAYLDSKLSRWGLL